MVGFFSPSLQSIIYKLFSKHQNNFKVLTKFVAWSNAENPTRILLWCYSLGDLCKKKTKKEKLFFICLIIAFVTFSISVEIYHQNKYIYFVWSIVIHYFRWHLMAQSTSTSWIDVRFPTDFSNLYDILLSAFYFLLFFFLPFSQMNREASQEVRKQKKKKKIVRLFFSIRLQLSQFICQRNKCLKEHILATIL